MAGQGSNFNNAEGHGNGAAGIDPYQLAQIENGYVDNSDLLQ